MAIQTLFWGYLNEYDECIYCQLTLYDPILTNVLDSKLSKLRKLDVHVPSRTMSAEKKSV